MLNRSRVSKIWQRVSPGVVTILLRSRSSAAGQATFTDYTIEHAMLEPGGMTTNDNISGVLIEDQRSTWQVWQDALDEVGAPAPKKGDVIRQTLENDSTVDWLIVSIESELFGSPFICNTQRESV